MKKYYHLANCTTCQRILAELGDLISDFEEHEIKSTPMSSQDLNEMKKRSGSYESLFSRRAMKYKSMGLADQNLTEDDYRKLIQEEYTFLKRPVFIVEDEIFVGNSKKEIERLKIELS